ncbi:MAG TPA: hypothetical protein VMW49_01405 [Candidatus Dormibacteraeota bacterium]|nr:hypothetical protein [Candidatus Dormibacteraeota bacterium]
MSTLANAAVDRREVGLWTMVLAVGTTVLAASVLAVGYATSWGGAFNPAQSAAALPAAATGVDHIALTIVLGPKGPAYVPANFTVPAHATVVVSIMNFDGSTPLTPALASHARVTGTVGGTMTERPLNPDNPNAAAGPGRALRTVGPQLVSHTFTVPALGLNVPVLGQSVTTFTIHTGKAGQYPWQCFDPCGDGPTGWAGPMADAGFMRGTLTVAA